MIIVEGTDIVCVCANDGIVKNKRGINVPGVKLGFDYLSPKDTADITLVVNKVLISLQHLCKTCSRRLDS